MGFFNPLMVNDHLPKDWEKYSLHVEVSVDDEDLINHLENTKWVCFSDSSIITGDEEGIKMNRKKWYGLRLINH